MYTHWQRPPTGHIHRAVLIRSAADAQLPVVVQAPALDPATGNYRARVIVAGADGDGGDAWWWWVGSRDLPCLPPSRTTPLLH
jgi:hypothetical protein